MGVKGFPCWPGGTRDPPQGEERAHSRVSCSHTAPENRLSPDLLWMYVSYTRMQRPPDGPLGLRELMVETSTQIAGGEGIR